MKGVILAGGLGTRLFPLTHATNKHLLPVYDKPMVYYPIRTLVEAGISEILIVVGGPYAGDFIRVLKNGKEFGIKHLEFAYQEGEGGIADALKLAEDFTDKDSLCVILGDNTTDTSIKKDVKNFKAGAKIFLRKVSDPQRFGVPVFEPKVVNTRKKRITAIEEKPKKPKSNYAVTGLYMYDNRVFDFIRKCKPSKRGELEITDVNNFYIKDGSMDWTELKGYWSDAGTFDSLFLTSKFWAEKKNTKLKKKWLKA